MSDARGRAAVAILAKAPVAGYAKTRLAAAIGDAAAAAVAARLLDRAVRHACDAATGPVTVWAAPDGAHPAFERLRRDCGVAVVPQGDGDLGARMSRVFASHAAAGGGPLLLTGSDAPALDAAALRDAAAALADHDAVFVPALDGGYVLVGLRGWGAREASLFDAMRWSTPTVMAETRRRIAAAGLRHAERAPLPDIDTADDLVHLPPGWLPAAVTMRTDCTGPDAMNDETTPPAPQPTLPPDRPRTDDEPATGVAPHDATGDAGSAASDDASAAVPAAETAETADTAEPATAADEPRAAGTAAADGAPSAPAAEPQAKTPPAADADPDAAADADDEAPAAAGPQAPDLTPAACGAKLAERFPALFGAGRALPVKLRIQADIQQRAPGEFSRKSLSAFLHRHTTGTAYLKALAKAPHRIDLDGQPAGEIETAHRVAAATEVERRQGLFDAKRAAERAAINAKHAAERSAANAERRQAEAERRKAEAERRKSDAALREIDAAADVERRERAALLRAYESSTLTRANFCALKGIAEAELDPILHKAWLEREARSHEARPGPGAARGDAPAAPGAGGREFHDRGRGRDPQRGTGGGRGGDAPRTGRLGGGPGGPGGPGGAGGRGERPERPPGRPGPRGAAEAGPRAGGPRGGERTRPAAARDGGESAPAQASATVDGDRDAADRAAGRAPDRTPDPGADER